LSALCLHPELRSRYVMVACEGFPTLHIRFLVRNALDTYTARYEKELRVFGLWDFDIDGIKQVKLDG